MFMTGKQKLGFKILAIALGATLILSSFTGCVTKKEPLTFADLDWDSAQLNNRIAAFIFEHGYGYEIEYNFGSTIPMFVGLTDGSNDISMEIWVENQQAAYDEAIAEGTIVDIGTNFSDSWQGWLVPTYMITDGDLPADISVEDMPQYWELFQDPEDPSKGRFYSCIAGWACELINEEKFGVYGLDDTYNIFLPGTGAALLTSMVSAYENHEPWFGYYWEPTPALGKYDMTHVAEPTYNETTWSTNHGCAYPDVKVNICVHSSLPDRAPEVVEVLEKYSTTTAIMNDVLAYMEDNEATTEEAAIWFLQEYESLWTQWVPSDVVDKVKDALP
jgi:glycine betaine/proline transport system substrate-binding protein